MDAPARDGEMDHAEGFGVIRQCVSSAVYRVSRN